MKTHIFFLFLTGISFVACQTYTSQRFVATKTMPYKTNVVGIAGEPAETPYVEIIYSEANGMDGNITKSIMVSPPYAFKNDSIIIKYDSVLGLLNGEEQGGYILMLNRSHAEGGSEYFRIVNHSEDKTVEFFLAGAQDVITEEDNTSLPYYMLPVLPDVYYRHAPVYYLLFPDRKYHKNFDFDEPLYFEGNRCGDLELTDAWSANEVAKLYRAEYNSSKDTVLYMSASQKNGSRLSSPKSQDSYLKYKTFYGTIPPKGEYKADENFWLMATLDMFYNLVGEGEVP